MKRIVLSLLSFLICLLLQAQSTIPASGGNATGTGGSVPYSVGQVIYTTNTGINGSAAQGVQQPNEISVITAIENTKEINLECSVYPNPTRGLVKLIVESSDQQNMRFLLYDINGVLLQDKKVESRETEISMDSLLPSTYFLKILSGNREIKTFKIIKN